MKETGQNQLLLATDNSLKKEFFECIVNDETNFNSIQEHGTDGIILYDPIKKSVWCNENFLVHLNPKDDPVLLNELRQQVLKQVPFSGDRLTLNQKEITLPEGQEGEIKGYFKLLTIHESIRILILLKASSPIKNHEHSEELFKTRHQAAMQELLIHIFSKYINLPLEDVDHTIQSSLKQVGEFVAVDRAYVFDYDLDKKVCNNTHEWCAEGIEPQIENSQNLPLDVMPDLVSSHDKGDPYYIPHVKQMPDIGLKEILEDQDIKSLLTVPLLQNGMAIGFVGFDSVRKSRSYSSKEIGLLQLFAEMLVNIRLRTQKQIEAQELLHTTTNQNKRDGFFFYHLS